jgi:hypothetical protein
MFGQESITGVGVTRVYPVVMRAKWVAMIIK